MALRNTIDYNHYRGNVQTTAAAEPVVTTTELENWLKIPAGDETANLTLMIASATDWIERSLGCCLVSQGFTLTLDRWPIKHEPWWSGVRQAHVNVLTEGAKAADVEIPRWPLVGIDSMTVDGNSITTNDVFIVDTSQRYGRLVLRQGQTFPVINTATANAIVIVYTAGYGAASDVPSLLKQAVLQMAAYMFENRGDGCSADDAADKSGAKSLISQYKIGRL